MRTYNFRVSDPVYFVSSRGKEEGFIIRIRGAKANVLVDDGTEFSVSLPLLHIRKGVAPKRVLTKTQMVRLGFHVGDLVSFADGNGNKVSGFVQRLNPKQARIHANDRVWSVSYSLLEKEGAYEQSLKNIRRLEKIEKYADQQLEKHGLSSWRFVFDNAARRYGACFYEDKVISMSEQFCLKSTKEDIKDVLLHEIAHALVGEEHGHDAVWRTKAFEIGSTGRRTRGDKFAPPNFIISCEVCGWNAGRDQRKNGMVCNSCRTPITYELYTPVRWPSYKIS